MIYISWLHHEKSYLVEQSPIMMAMLESAEKTHAELERKEKEASRLIGPRKSQRKIIKQTPGFSSKPPVSAINNILNKTNPTAGPALPSAGDYIPPASFLQNMSNPQNEAVYPKSVPEYFKR
jgi:hypothetical protein